MSLQKENIFGARLKLARKLAGLSLQELSDILQTKVTKQALSKYEKGLMNPSGDILLSIAEAFNLKPDYFFKRKSVQLGEILFRKRARLSKKQEESIIEKVRDYTERFLEIENILTLDNNFINPIKKIKINSKQHAGFAAQELRRKWNLGNDSISNLVEMLELNGIKVFLLEEVDDFDGLAVLTSKGLPIVTVNIKNKPIERIRFTILHELAHLILNFDEATLNDSKKVEVLCHYFSSCLLIPNEILFKLIGQNRNYIRINELISIKESYGISIRAIVHRLKELKVINENYYKRWMIYMSKTYGSKNEPGKYKSEEKAKTFDRLVNKALAEELITLSKAAALWNVDIDLIRKGYSGK